MSRIRDIIKADSIQLAAGTDGIENSWLKTTSRLLIADNKAVLPTATVGDIIWNMAIVFDSLTTNVIYREVTVTTDSLHVIFDPLDSMNGLYCVVSYLTKKEI